MYASIPSVIILRLNNLSNISAISWQASYDIGNKEKMLGLRQVQIKWVTVTTNNKFYHYMSRLLCISICIYRCFIHSRCHHRLLSNIWFNKCVIVHHIWMSRRIFRPCGSHEGMRYHLKPLHVVCYTLSKHNIYLTHQCKVFKKLNPSIINIFYR